MNMIVSISTAIITLIAAGWGAWEVTGDIAKRRQKLGHMIARPDRFETFFIFIIACVIYTALHSLSADIGALQWPK